MSTRFYLDAAHEPADWLTPILAQHRHWWSQQVEVCQDDTGDIVLRGCVASYHHKQLAQEAFLRLPQNARVRNELQVMSTHDSLFHG